MRSFGYVPGYVGDKKVPLRLTVAFIIKEHGKLGRGVPISYSAEKINVQNVFKDI